MAITRVWPQLRTTDLAGSIRFYTDKLGFALEFRVEDFYAGGTPDPSIPHVAKGEHLHLYFGQGRSAPRSP